MNLFKDIGGFLKTLSSVDIIFFFAVVLLIILVISLIYFLRVNENVLKDDKEIIEEEPLVDLKTITKAIENKEKLPIELTKYEDEQEEKAIISYDELLSKCKNNNINYEREEVLDDLIIKKVNLNPSNNEYQFVDKTDDKEFVKMQIFTYEKEEAFLEALNKLRLGLVK